MVVLATIQNSIAAEKKTRSMAGFFVGYSMALID